MVTPGTANILGSGWSPFPQTLPGAPGQQPSPPPPPPASTVCVPERERWQALLPPSINPVELLLSLHCSPSQSTKENKDAASNTLFIWELRVNWEKPLFPAVSGGGPLPACLQVGPPSAPRTSGVSATAGRLCAQEGCIFDAQTRWSLDRTARVEMMQGLRHVVHCPPSAAQGCPLVAGSGIACSGRLRKFEPVLHHLPEPEGKLRPGGLQSGVTQATATRGCL